MTNVPSDMICDDNTCETEVNMIYRLGEHRAVQNELVILNGQKVEQLLLVHKHNGEKRYIALKNSKLIWYDQDGKLKEISDAPNAGLNVQAEAIGNTLIALSEKGIGYYLWKQDKKNYQYLGNKIPEPKVSFATLMDTDSRLMADSISLEGICDKRGFWEPDKEYVYIGDGKQEAYNNAAVGVYSKNKNQIAGKNGFCNPFFVRYALELFDGSYTCISVPILVTPVIGQNSYWVTEKSQDDDKYRLITRYSKLLVKKECDYSQWTDIVKRICIFMTEGVDNYNTDTDQAIGTKATLTKKWIVSDNAMVVDGKITFVNTDTVSKDTLSSKSSTDVFMTALSETQDVIPELKRDSVFYKVAELSTATSGWERLPIEKGKLKNLNTQQRLEDDYYSNCVISSRRGIMYNGRLNLFGIRRYPWAGGTRLTLCDYNGGLGDWQYAFDIYVYIKTSSGDRIVHNEFRGRQQFLRTYFFYPDPRAYKVVVILGRSKGDNILIFEDWEKTAGLTGVQYLGHSEMLEESPYLNGASFWGKMPSEEDNILDTSFWQEYYDQATPEIETVVPKEDVRAETFNNQIWTSEVNNPWVFSAKGNNTIGTGDIIGLATQTTALSQGQFGQYPLLALCTDGIWALQTNSEGLYSMVHPMSREICNNEKSIIETDGLVFFTSEKGLMMINGSQVTCVSEQLSGKYPKTDETIYKGTLSDSISISFKDFLRNCFIAYDYRDSLLWIMNDQYDYLYLYSIKDGTFAVKTGSWYERCINDYPDTLLQAASGGVYSLLERDDINFDGAAYTCELITRPMKWENSTALKTLSRVKMVYDQNSGGKQVSGKTNIIYVYASNDCKTWTRVKSLRGRGFKYWKFVIQLKKIRAVDTFSGVLINTQERYTNRIR